MFYVVDARHDGNAVLHANARNVVHKTGLPFVFTGSASVTCCFRFGPKTGVKQAAIKINHDDPPLISEEGDETFQFAGHVTLPVLAASGRPADRLAFGIQGMGAVVSQGRHTYQVTLADPSRTVIVRHCRGTEGINFALYHRLTDKKPFATYYYALGYDVEADCRG